MVFEKPFLFLEEGITLSQDEITVFNVTNLF